MIETLSSKVGNTPLFTISTDDCGGGIFAKCEWTNPTGTVKDRAAISMIADAVRRYSSLDEARDKLHILEYSGGSLAFSIARFCKELQLRNTLVVSSGMGTAACEELRILGSTVVVCPKELGFLAVMSKARELAASDPSLTFLYQHENQANYIAHRDGTAVEILRQLDNAPISAWIASVGTGASLMGVGSRLKAESSLTQIHAVLPAELPYGSPQPPNGLRKLAGSGGLGNGLKQTFVKRKEQDVHRFWNIPWSAAAEEMISIYKQFEFRIGSSAAANLLVAKNVYSSLGLGHTVVTIFPSAGSQEEWEAVHKI